MAIDPVSASLIIGGTLIKAFGGAKAARKAKEQAETNAIYREFGARDAIVQGQKQSAQIKSKARSGKAQLTASAAAQGLDVTSGTVGTLQDEFNYQSEQDVATMQNNAMREAFGIRTNARMQVEQAKLNQKAARFEGLSSLLTGGAEAAKYLRK